MMKNGYDTARRTLAPKTLITIQGDKPTQEDILCEDYVPADLPEEPEEIAADDNPQQTETVPNPSPPPAETATVPRGTPITDLSQHPNFHEWRKDARGRRYAYDVRK